MGLPSTQLRGQPAARLPQRGCGCLPYGVGPFTRHKEVNHVTRCLGFYRIHNAHLRAPQYPRQGDALDQPLSMEHFSAELITSLGGEGCGEWSCPVTGDTNKPRRARFLPRRADSHSRRPALHGLRSGHPGALAPPVGGWPPCPPPPPSSPRSPHAPRAHQPRSSLPTGVRAPDGRLTLGGALPVASAAAFPEESSSPLSVLPMLFQPVPFSSWSLPPRLGLAHEPGCPRAGGRARAHAAAPHSASRTGDEPGAGDASALRPPGCQPPEVKPRGRGEREGEGSGDRK